MKQPGTLVFHADESYLLVEGGYNPETRTVLVMAKPENSLLPQESGVRAVAWRDQGSWYPVARWSSAVLTLQQARHEGARAVLDGVVRRYLANRAPDPEVAWAVAGETGFEGSLEEVIPMGLAVTLWDGRQAAAEAATQGGVVPIHNVARFLTHLAREGYAGAMWNSIAPVFFCLDDEGELQFLRIQRGTRKDVQMQILDPVGGWSDYEGEETIEFLENRDACDARLVKSLGRLPVLEWPGERGLWSVGPARGEPGVVESEEDGIRYGLLFGGEQLADAWREEIEEEWTTWPVRDLPAFLGHADLQGCGGGLLNPGDHRARSGVLWWDGQRVVLDAFSGFWALESGVFVPTE